MSSGIRVLHVISEMGTGGAESLVVELVRQGARAGWVSAVATAGGRRADELLREGTAIHPVHLPRRSAVGVLRAARDARRAVRRFAPDVVLAHNVSASTVGRLATAGRKVPVLTVFHGVAAADYPTAARLLPRTSTAVVAVSAAIRDRLTAAGMAGAAPTVICNAVSVPSGVTDRAIARAGLGLDDGTPVALCLARMAPQKRHDVLLDAWATVAGPAVLLLAGDGPLRPALEARAAALGLTDRVRFLGTRSDVATLLLAADITVLTSDWEGLPIAVLESLAAGRPVVATDVDGVREVLEGGGGLLVPPGDPAATATAVNDLLGDPFRRARAATEGLATVSLNYDPEKMIMKYDALMHEHLERSWS
jgi:glycosyltransferase involved in cell wall biosynthesis